MEASRTFSKREQRIVLAASCVAIFITPLMATMVNLALSHIGHDFGLSTYEEAWITVSYLLSSVVFLLPWAKGADLIGKRKVFLIGLVITMVGAMLASISPNFVSLIACRVLMGLGGAAISCTSIALISEVFPRNQRGGALGLNTAIIYLGAAVGPALGGALTDTLGWHSTFYVIVPFCIVALFLMLSFKHEFVAAKGETFDTKGAVVYGIAVIVGTIGILNITEWFAIPCIIAGLVMFGLFYYTQKHGHYPLMNIRVFSNRRYTRSVVTALLNYGSAYAVSFFAALYLQDVNNWSATQAGAILLIQPIIQAIFTPITGKLSDKVDGRLLPTIGMALTCAGLIVIFMFPQSVDTTLVILALVFLGFGYAFFSAPNTNVVMSSVDHGLYSEASATLGTMRQAGMLMSMGIAMACISIFMGDMVHFQSDAFMDAMKAAFMICAVLSFVGIFLSWFRGNDDALIEDV